MSNMVNRVARRWLQSAPAGGLDPRKVYYHGTPPEKAGKAILRTGIEPPDLTTRGGAYRPVEGKVYLTPHLAYAILYTFGGQIAEKFMWAASNQKFVEDSGYVQSEFPKHMWGGSEWGYLFVVPGKALTEIHPDEDSIGEMIGNGTAPSWLLRMAKHILTQVHPETQPNRPNSFHYPSIGHTELANLQQQNLYDLMMDYGEFQLKAQAVAGKILLGLMTPEQELRLLQAGAHVAHEGTVTPTQCWKIHKGEAHLVKPDGSNFFKVARRCR